MYYPDYNHSPEFATNREWWIHVIGTRRKEILVCMEESGISTSIENINFVASLLEQRPGLSAKYIASIIRKYGKKDRDF